MAKSFWGLLTSIALVAGFASPAMAEAGGYSLLAEPWVFTGKSGDSIRVYGAVFNDTLPDKSRSKPDRVVLEQQLVTDGVGRWVERDSQPISFAKRPDEMALKLKWRVPPDISGAKVRTVIYKGRRAITYSGWNRLGLRHLTAQRLGEDGCAIRSNGQVYCWPVGYMNYPGATYRRKTLTSVAVGGLARVKQLAGACALRLSGQVYCWGDNDEQIVGDGSKPPTVRNRPVRIPGMSEVSSISSSGAVTCAVKQAGAVWCWGISEYGSLGTGSREHRTRWKPQKVKGLKHPKMLSTEAMGTCAITSDSRLSCWGPGPKDVYVPTRFSGLEDVTQVGVGEGASCALVASGQVYCWGENEEGQLGDGTRKPRAMPVPVSGLHDAVSISIGGLGNCAIREGGQVVCWGFNYEDRLGIGLEREVISTPRPVIGLDDATEIYTDSASHCALRENSEVWCWGYDTYGAAGNGYPGGTEFRSSEFPVPVRTG